MRRSEDTRRAVVPSRAYDAAHAGQTIPGDASALYNTKLEENFLRDYRINGRATIGDAEARWRLHIEPFFGSLCVSAVASDLLEHTLLELTVRKLLIGADH
jgi:hypothetical protein